MPRPSVFFNLILALVLLGCAAPAAHGQSQSSGALTGSVVDSQGSAIVRARVRLLDGNAREIQSTLTDDRGRFRFETGPCPNCRIEGSLTGFAPAAMSATSGDMRIVLQIAPVREDVVISATRDIAPASQVGSSVTVLSADEIDRRGAPLVADLLRAVPAVTVVRSGGLGNQTSVFVRGGESTYNKVLLDGIPVNEPGGTFNFSNLTSAHLDRIEIVRGPQSALFGSDAMSSVIHLVTRRADRAQGRVRGTAAIEYGGYGTLRAGAGLAGTANIWDYAVDVSRLSTDNRIANNEFDNTTASWSAGAEIRDGLSIRAVGRVERQRVGTPGATTFGGFDSDAFFQRRDAVAGMSLEHLRSNFKQRVAYGFTSSDQTSTNLFLDPPYTPSFGDRSSPFAFFDFPFDSRNVLRRHHLTYQADWRFDRMAGLPGNHFVTAAVDWDGERAELNDRLAGTTLTAARNNTGVALQHQVVAGRLSVATGVRLEHNASFGNVVVERISGAYQLRSSSGAFGATTLKANFGRGVKEPTIIQSFSLSPFFLGNPDLEPERAIAFDWGLEQRLFADRAKVDIVWFDNRYRNQISTRTIGFNPFIAQFFNIGRTRARGLEIAVEAAPSTALRARAGYTFLASRIVESTSSFSPVFAEGQWAFRRPRHAGFLDASWQFGRLDITLGGTFVGRRVDSDFSSLEPPLTSIDSHALWMLGARYQLTRQVDWTMRVENLANVEYMEPLGYPAWKRTWHTGVRVRF